MTREATLAQYEAAQAHMNRRAQIAAAAARLFVSEGVANVSMLSIADDVGLAKATVYHYFSSKDEILYAIHEQMFTILSSRAEARSNSGASSIDRLYGVISDVFEVVHTHAGYSRVVFEHLRQLSSPYKEKVRENQVKYERAVQSIFIAGLREGVLREVDPNLAALALFGMINWSHQWYSPNGPHAPEELAREFFGIFLGGVGTPKGVKAMSRAVEQDDTSASKQRKSS